MRIFVGFLLLAATGAQAATITVGRKDCEAIVAHEPAADVAYVAGRDTKGRPVAPADLPGSRPLVLPEIEILITADLRDRLGIPIDPKQYRGEVSIGRVTMAKGQLALNGKPIASGVPPALAQACRDWLERTR